MPKPFIVTVGTLAIAAGTIGGTALLANALTFGEQAAQPQTVSPLEVSSPTATPTPTSTSTSTSTPRPSNPSDDGAPLVVTPQAPRHVEDHHGRGSDDGPNHDLGDDHGGDRADNVSDDGPAHDRGDDHGGDDHGGDDHGGRDDRGRGSDDGGGRGSGGHDDGPNHD